MKTLFRLLPLLVFVGPCVSEALAQKLIQNVPYVEDGHARNVLDIYTPEDLQDSRLPVMFWIHGGGWQVGDKSDVAIKPQVLTDRGFVFVSTNYRLLPEVTMEELTTDVAKSLGWVHDHIAEYGGDSERIFVGGHSAGAQLAALLCTDERYLNDQGVTFDVLKGCIPVDGDTYDIPKIIMTAEFRRSLYESFDIEAEYRFEELERGTRVTQESTVSGKGFVKLMFALFGWLMKKQGCDAVHNELESFKEKLESDAGCDNVSQVSKQA